MFSKTRRRIVCVLVFLGLSILDTPANSTDVPPVYPCRASEPPLASGEPNPTIRDPIVKFEDVDMRGPDVVAKACIVTSHVEEFPSNGLHFDWNLGLIGAGGELVDVFGTVARIGPFAAGGPETVTQHLSSEWWLGNDQPLAWPGALLAQVAVEPCLDTKPNCSFSANDASYVTVLMRPSRSRTRDGVQLGGQADLLRESEVDGCLAPLKSGLDYELRQLTVVAHGGSYRVFTCLVSNRFALFPTSRFHGASAYGGRDARCDENRRKHPPAHPRAFRRRSKHAQSRCTAGRRHPRVDPQSGVADSGG